MIHKSADNICGATTRARATEAHCNGEASGHHHVLFLLRYTLSSYLQASNLQSSTSLSPLFPSLLHFYSLFVFRFGTLNILRITLALAYSSWTQWPTTCPAKGSTSTEIWT